MCLNDWSFAGWRERRFRVLRFTEGQIRSKPEVVLATIVEAAGR